MERTFKIGDKVTFTAKTIKGRSINFTVKEGVVVGVADDRAGVKVGRKQYVVKNSGLRHANERNTLSEVFMGKEKED